jgi:hypothetical protein
MQLPDEDGEVLDSLTVLLRPTDPSRGGAATIRHAMA